MAKNCALYVAKNCAVLLAEKCALYITTHMCAGADLKAECDYENDTNFERYLPKRKQRTPRFGVAFTVLAPLEDCRSKITCFE